MKYIKTIDIKGITKIYVYQYKCYELCIEISEDGRMILGHHLEDKEGMFYPTFTITNHNMTIESYEMRISLNRINKLIEALKTLQEIQSILPEIEVLIDELN